MTDSDVLFSHAESTIYELRKCLELIIIAHETGRYEPLQAAIEAAVIKVAELDMQAVATGELERLLAENEKLRNDRDFAIGWITALANNPYKPMTWMQTREAAADCLAALQGDAP